MNLNELLSILGYNQSLYYRNSEDQFEPETVHLFRSARRTGVDGIYVFQTATSNTSNAEFAARPAVFVAQANTLEEARQIHRRLWNLRYAPLLIILLPNQIRIYTGFDYSQDPHKEDGLLDEKRFDEAFSLLPYLSADAIDSGQVWDSEYAKRFNQNRQVDTRLLANLRTLSEVLDRRLNKTINNPTQRSGVAHSLIGKFIYIRYLRDRNILSDTWLAQNDINLDFVLSRHATVKELKKLITLLENRFNGFIFPLDVNLENVLTDPLVSLVASVFRGDEVKLTEFDISQQLHLDFQAYDFQYIPVETLSAIYEQFLRAEEDVKQTGAIYTPEILADYLLSEVNWAKKLTRGMKILDPACGSGIFLVLAYRRLIEMELAKHPDQKLSPQELKSILLESLYGVERKQYACHVTEFSLILTLLHYVDPPELHKNHDFKFPNLHNERIVESDFFDDNLIFLQQGLKFDWIVGNPPWIELKPNTKNEELVRKWIAENQKEKPVAGNRVADAFSWRVMDILEDEGVVGLILPATSLFNLESKKYRQKFFQEHEVVRVTNFANLRDVLFDKRATLPAATVVYRKAIGRQDRPYIIHYGPLSINQISISTNKPWAITINENEIQVVSPYEAEKGDTSVWKFALWGNHFDQRAIERLCHLFPSTLKAFCKQRGWDSQFPRQGAEFCDDQSKPIAKIKGKKLFNTDVFNKIKPRYRFSIPEGVLQEIEQDAHIRRGEEALSLTTSGPHIILSPAWNNFIIYSDEDFIIRPRQMGISAPKKDKPYLQALSIYLSSSLVAYYLFFHTQQWGIFRQAKLVSLAEVRKIPTPNFTESQANELAQLQQELVQIERKEISHPLLAVDLQERLQNKLDEQVFNILEIPGDIATLAREFMQIRLQLDKGQKAIQRVVRPPDDEELLGYAQELKDELDDFVLGTAYHQVTITRSKELIECKIKVTSGQGIVPVNGNSIQEGDLTIAKFLAEIRQNTNQRFSQWVYIRRGLRLFDGPNIYIYKSPRLIDWTRTQALSDASDIIGQVYSSIRTED